MNKKFNTQFATQKLRQETSATNFGGATFTPGTGEQMATNKAFKKKEKKDNLKGKPVKKQEKNFVQKRTLLKLAKQKLEVKLLWHFLNNLPKTLQLHKLWRT